MMKLSIRWGIFTYFLCACAVTVIFMLVFVFSCNCDNNCLQQRDGYGTLSRSVSKLELPKTYLLIVIMSHAKESATRAVIRDTWLKLSSKGPYIVRHKFSMGTANLSVSTVQLLKEEQKLHGDLLFVDSLIDTYSNLTRKTLWSIDLLCHQFRFDFLLKVDSDSFVRLGAFLKDLRSVAHPHLYWGFLDGRARPRRKGQWAEKDWVLCDRYLPYQLGGGYVISHALADYISRNKNLLKLFNNEDVSVGAWLAGLNVKYIHDPRFDTEFRSRGCNNEYLITHKQGPSALEQLYSTLIESGKLCKTEFRARSSYVYDWSVPPSMCCVRNNRSSIP